MAAFDSSTNTQEPVSRLSKGALIQHDSDGEKVKLCDEHVRALTGLLQWVGRLSVTTTRGSII